MLDEEFPDDVLGPDPFKNAEGGKHKVDPRARERLKKSRGTGRRPGRPRKGEEVIPRGSYESVWSPLARQDGSPGPQFALLSCPFPEIFFGGARGGGKALPLTEVVVTPIGYRPMGELKAGDQVHGPGGTVVTVIGVYPQGSEDVFRITLVDGRTVRASRGHLWRMRVGPEEMLVTTDYMRMLMDSSLEVSLPVETLDHWVAIRSIIYDGLDHTQCIKVDSADGLFLTNDEIITHNTDGAIGKWLQHAARYGENAKGVFFRRRFKQLEEVQARCTALFPKIGASYHKGDATWIFPNNAVLKLRHLWDVAATEEYQGHNYCVAKGTPVLMADGSYKPIEAVQVGELVMTLEGPKPVTGRMAPTTKPCVLAEIFDADGVKIGEQIHPEDHPVLTSVSPQIQERRETDPASSMHPGSHALGSAPELLPCASQDPAFRRTGSDPQCPSGSAYSRSSRGSSQNARLPLEYPSPWQSYTTLLDAHRESLDLSALSADGQTDYRASEDEHREGLPLLPLSCPVVLHGPDPRLGRPYPHASIQYRTYDRCSGLLPETYQDSPWSRLGLPPLVEPFLSRLDCSSEHLPFDADACVQHGSRKASDFLSGYVPGFHPCDERPRLVQECDLSRAPLPDDAALRIQQNYSKGEGDCAPTHTHDCQVSYVHPYTGEHRNLSQAFHVGTVVFSPCGPHEVYDLTIAHANHYITSTKVINQNSFLCFEELTNWPSPDAIDRMRGVLRSAKGVPVELIMTGNPGGAGHCVPYGLVKTPTGWKDIKDFQVGDAVLTVTADGEIVPSVVDQVHRERYNGPMMTITEGGMSMVFTANHKIAIRGPDNKLSLVPFNELPERFTIPRTLSSNGIPVRMDHVFRPDLELSKGKVELDTDGGEVYCIGVPETHSFIIQQNGSIWVSGNSWVKARYIAPAPQGWTPIRDIETGEYRIYIPSRLEDNTAMMKNDPNYARRLRATGSEALVRAWLGGDWDVVAVGFFDDLIRSDRHFLTPFEIPLSWSWRRSFDWGSAAPASLGVWAISDGSPVEDLDGYVFPRGSMIRVKEWYTIARNEKSGDIIPNQGLRLTNLALGNGIAQRSLGYRFSGCVADPSIFSKLGRESIYDEMKKGAKEAGHNLIFSPADNNRIQGWQKMRDMLENSAQEYPEKPGLWVMENCHHWLRTVPVLQRTPIPVNSELRKTTTIRMT